MPIRMTGMVSNLDTDAIIKELMSAQSLKRTRVEQNKTKLEWKKEKWGEMNKKIYSLYTEQLSKLKLQGTYLQKKVTSSSENKATAEASTAANGSYQLQIERLASAQYVTGADIRSKGFTKDTTLMSTGFTGTSINITVYTAEEDKPESTSESTAATEETGGTETPEATEPSVGTAGVTAKTVALSIDSETTIGDFVSKLKEAGLNAGFDEKQGRFYISAKNSGADNRFTIVAEGTAPDTVVEGETVSSGLSVLGLGNITEELAREGQSSTGSSMMTVVAAQNARLTLNGAVLEAADNTVTANGLTVKLSGTTGEGEIINLTVDNDTDSVYDLIKETITKYNELLKEMNDSYSAASAKGYDVLTEEQKKEMSEEQIKLWEDKIKDSLLRRDDVLNGIINTMRTALQKGIEIDGKNYGLSTYGIVTGVYTEKGQLHIEGNADDGVYATKADRLKEALNTDSEKVAEVLSGVFSNLYSDLTEKMKASTISSALTFYNDKQMQTQIDNYKKDITRWDKRLTELEDRYYKQYTAMESAMAKMQSQQNQLAGMLG